MLKNRIVSLGTLKYFKKTFVVSYFFVSHSHSQMEHFMSYFMYPHQACHTRDHGGSIWEAPAIWGVMAAMLLGGAKRHHRAGCLASPVLSVVNCKSNGLWIASLLHQYDLRDKNFRLSMFVCPPIAWKPDFGGCLDPFLWIMNAVYSHTLLIMQIVQTNLPSLHFSI